MFWSTPDPLSVFFGCGGGVPIESAVGHIPLPLPKTLNKIWGKGIHYGESRPLAKKAARTTAIECKPIWDNGRVLDTKLFYIDFGSKWWSIDDEDDDDDEEDNWA